MTIQLSDIFPSSICVILLFFPLAVWSSGHFSKQNFKFGDNLIWWVSTIQASSLVTLWIGKFTTPWFLTLFIAISLILTSFRAGAECEDVLTVRGRRAGLGSGIVATMIALALIGPFKKYIGVPMGWDALSYHLPMAAQWVQTHTILAQDSRVWFYPGGYEILTAVFFLLVGDDSLWFFPDIVSWTILVVSLWRLAIGLGMGETISGIIISSLVISPLFYRLLGQGDNDILVAGLVVSVMGSLIRCHKRPSREAWGVALVSLGMLSSVKYSSMAWLPIGLPYLLFVRRRSRGGEREMAYELLCLFLSVFPLASFLVRNWLLVGNPVYPVGLGSIIPWSDLSQIVSTIDEITPDKLRSTALIEHGLPALKIFFYKLDELYVPLWVLLFVIGYGFVANVRAVRDASKGFSLIIIISGVLISLAIFVTQPLVVETVIGTSNQISSGSSLRFALPWIALLSVLLLSLLPGVGLQILFSVSLFMYFAYIQGVTDEYIVVFVCVMLIWRMRLKNIGYVMLLVPVFLLSLSGKYSASRSSDSADAYGFQGKSDIIGKMSLYSCSHVIVVSTGLRAWPFIGPRFTNRVISVGMSKSADVFKRRVEDSRASVVVTSRGYGTDLSPDYGEYYPSREQLLYLLGDDWRVGYEDGYTVAFVPRDSIVGCMDQ